MTGRFVLGVMLFCACDAELASNLTDGGNGGGGDGSGSMQGDGGGSDAMVPLGPWGAPAKVPGADSAADEDDATLSSNRLELYFKREDSDSANLYVMTRATPTSAFGAPTALTVLNSTVDEESPRLSPDDLTLYFGRNGDMYKATRAAVGSPWSGAQAVGAFNTTAYEKWGVACASGYAMVSRAVANEGQNLFEGDVSSTVNMAVSQLNSNSAEQGLFLSNDCLRVYFQSNRSNNQFDIYMATRVTMTSAWSNPTALTDFNTAGASEEDPWISNDQRTFVFTSNSSGSKDVYISTR